jgi:hypothetical protein
MVWLASCDAVYAREERADGGYVEGEMLGCVLTPRKEVGVKKDGLACYNGSLHDGVRSGFIHRKVSEANNAPASRTHAHG